MVSEPRVRTTARRTTHKATKIIVGSSYRDVPLMFTAIEHACPDECRGKTRKKRIITDNQCRDGRQSVLHFDKLFFLQWIVGASYRDVPIVSMVIEHGSGGLDGFPQIRKI
jgi:hypothetical protein